MGQEEEKPIGGFVKIFHILEKGLQQLKNWMWKTKWKMCITLCSKKLLLFLCQSVEEGK